MTSETRKTHIYLAVCWEWSFHWDTNNVLEVKLGSSAVCRTASQLSVQESFSVWTQRGLGHILVLVWTSRDRCVNTDQSKRAACLMFYNLKPFGDLCKAVWVQPSVSAKLVAVYWPVRPVDWLPGVAPGKCINIYGSDCSRPAVTERLSLFASQTKVG